MSSLVSGRWAAAVVMLLSWLALPSFATTAFVATMRAPSGSTEAGGHLYRVDVATGKSTFVGRILIDGTQPAGLTAMAFHPETGVLYAVTVGINDAGRAALLTVDPHTAQARVVGRLSRPLTDISFDPMGRLYGWTANTGQLAIIDVLTGKVSTVGPPSEPATGGAFAIDSRGNAYVATWSDQATLDRIDLKVGTVAPGPPLSNLRDVSRLRSMAFSADGELLGTHSIRDTRASSVLLRIDPGTGNVAAIADIPDDAEAIAVLAHEPGTRMKMQDLIAYAMLVAILLALAVLFFGSSRISGDGRRRWGG